ncbi:flavin reductase family protein [Streptomyces mirabilis]|uniref:flavin reductase family protein n=1 Tax=Streptomyces mirabilis TaxID=68239 RepID=UPI00365E68A9
MITVKDLQPHPLDQVHHLIEPGPVILVTTQHRGIPNVMTNGFNMMVRHAPPLIACTIGPWDHSYQALVETGECVISVPTADMTATVVDIGNCSGADVDKFEEFDLTAVAGAEVQAPLVAECFANIECMVTDSSLVAPYNLFPSRARQGMDRPLAAPTAVLPPPRRRNLHARWADRRPEGPHDQVAVPPVGEREPGRGTQNLACSNGPQMLRPENWGEASARWKGNPLRTSSSPVPELAR